MQYTPHIRLPLFESADKPTWLYDWNETMMKLDDTLFNMSSADMPPEIASMLARIEALERTVSEHTTSIETLEAEVTSILSDITDLQSSLDRINALIPSNASPSNQLATMADVSGGGQGGHDFNSDDFSINQNEVSLLDNRRIIEMTGAEYDALSQIEKMNGAAYFINDRDPAGGGGGGGTGGASIVPLTDEEFSQDQDHIIFFTNQIKDFDFILLTLTLTDGTYYINEETLPANQSWTFSFPVHGYSEPGTNDYVYRFSQPSVRSNTNPPAAGETHFIDFNLAYSNGIAFYGEFFDRNSAGGGITEYSLSVASIFGVKCGSGGGGSTGGSQIDYTTEEQNTGLKWINNKPVYQKTVVLSSLSSSSGVILSDVDAVINVGGFILRDDGVYKDYAPFYADNVKFIVFRVNTNHQLIYERGSADMVKRGTLTVTIRYTKTTD